MLKRLFLLLVALVALFCFYFIQKQKKAALPRNYYLSLSGNDNDEGSKSNPWKSITRLNNIYLKAGDTVFFKGGEKFAGNILIDSSKTGASDKHLVITSYGNMNAVIDGKNQSALTIYKSAYIKINDLDFVGAGRKNGNVKEGVSVVYSHDISIENINVKGFQKAGLLIYSCTDVKANKVYAYENGFAGISIDGEYQKHSSQRITISDCRAENNPGDPTNFTNHSGNGIIAGNCKNVVIEYSSATNNGWDMPRTGNGPVGIWCYEADSVIIQHCIAYRNKTSNGGGDGGGFDLDGGVTNSIIQYCLSYENSGSGFGIFQYAGASNWHDNTIRFCISENDGTISPAGAGVFIWNSSRDTAQFKRCYFYNNVVYNERASALSYSSESENTMFYFSNNIFVAKDSILIGKEYNGLFLGNIWWALHGRFNIAGITDFRTWAHQEDKEQLNQHIVGWNTRPLFNSPGNTGITDPGQLKTFYSYKLQKNSGSFNKGIDLKTLFQVSTGNQDFNGSPLTGNPVGAYNE